MGRGLNIPGVGVQNTISRGFDIPMARVSIYQCSIDCYDAMKN
jgi:hypothetical protein